MKTRPCTALRQTGRMPSHTPLGPMKPYIVLLGQQFMRNKALKLAFAASSVVISLAFFLAVLNAKLPAMVTLVLGVLCLAACGTGVAMAFGLESWGGIVLLRSRKGLGLLDGIAKRWPGLWQHF